MKDLFISAVVLTAALFSSIPSQAQADAVLGNWFNEEKDAKIEIYKNGNKYYGKIVWLKEPNNEKGQPKTDTKNPDEKLRNRKIIGLVIMEHFVYEDKEWVDGKIYDGKSGKTYNCKMKLKDSNILDVRGYLGAAWMGLGRTTSWTRAN
jgi:uncharacterized protein (DUF2147 family)